MQPAVNMAKDLENSLVQTVILNGMLKPSTPQKNMVSDPNFFLKPAMIFSKSIYTSLMITWSFNEFIKEDRQRYIGRKE